ncbi:MFS transporter [Agrococcus jejuensis]|uniref:Sugar phosphate permease n=1 Tax=Agrococcus jejuensis TaxID=399736 RepID=A0A1G8DYM9_9MICO|nr:MFS transporter [Agrococcus jejuensis]SDH62590.1 Sugar phosphate permease [Agrococcus jejuensis]
MAIRSTLRPIAGSGLMFATNGAIFAALLPWYPQLADRLGLGGLQFGLVVACFALGAVVSSALPAPLIRRFGARRVAVLGTVLVALAVAAAGWSTTGVMLAACILAVGFTDAIVDVAQNVAALRVQQRAGRPILGSLHALWSLGAAGSGAISTAVAASGGDLRIHLAVTGVVCVGLVGLAGWLVGPVPEAPVEEDAGVHGLARWRRVAVIALPIVVIAIAGTVVEDVANNWAALSGVQLAGLDASVAGIAFTVVIASQCVGRFTGDLLIHRLGRGTVARIGGALVALGGVAIVLASEPALLMAGFVLAGYGCATLVPSAFSAAGSIPGLSEGAGVTVVSWLMRLGFLGTSPLIGGLSDAVDLRAGLAVLVVAGLVVVVLAPRLEPGAQRAVPSAPAS